jgi:hypothetical protein
VPDYLVEVYVPTWTAAELPPAASRAQAGAQALAHADGAVRCSQLIFIPVDELCFYLYTGPSKAAVAEATTHAGVTLDRVVEAVQCHMKGQRS